MKSLVAVIIPFYKKTLTETEQIALKRCFAVLEKYPIIAVKPKQLHFEEVCDPNSFASVLSFDDRYFESIDGYNELLLNPLFYQAFLDYRYILIYQLDAFVFKDELLNWCSKGYDYVGAPWLRWAAYPDWFKKTKNELLQYVNIRYNIKIKNTDIPTDIQFENKVGNGGFSLRNTKKFYEIAVLEQELIRFYLSKKMHRYNEDVFWSIEVNRKKKRLKIPGYKEASFFSMESVGKYAIKLTNGKLPFGCHGWSRPEYLDFWRPYFKEERIVI